MITDIAHGEVDLDILKACASLIPAGKVIKLPKVIKAIGNVGKTGFKKGKEGEKIVWKRFTREDKPKPDKNKGNQSKAGSKSGITTGFKYKNNPMDNPKAAQDIVENPNAVYGYSPNPESTRIGKFANKIDWTNPDEVSIARQIRQAYHDANEAMLDSLYKKGYSLKEIAYKMIDERNANRLNSYIKNGDLEGLKAIKKSNLKTYGNENGMTLKQALEKYGSHDEIIKATTRSNPGMDACTGLYDIYHGGK